ncbi:MAG: NAD(P)H-dependent glycerol-3-phosphate dehydrogenase [Flavobacteriaceae bacterium]|nr:NAD(P)H-dependent glycerol-3-phosphate dehydrogenase [Flavobacteriaceae bacterium]
MSENIKVSVIGGGSWATAIVKMLCHNLDKVSWYMRNDNSIAHIKEHQHNPNYLSSAQLETDKLMLTSSINEAVEGADLVIFAIPSAFLSSELKNMTVPIKDKIVFSAIKGIEPNSGLIVGEYLHETYDVPFENIGVITGPCHAEEVAMERLSYLTLACQEEANAELLAKYLKSFFIRIKISDDIIGTEYAAMLKNIYAIAAGIAHGLGYGDNFQSVIMSNAIREMKRYIKKVHKMKRNINNSAYLGDLLVTGYSLFSRNRTFGNMIGKGYTVRAAKVEMTMVAEGYYATNSAYKINQRNGAKTPIIDAVYDILYNDKDARKVFKKLTTYLD